MLLYHNTIPNVSGANPSLQYQVFQPRPKENEALSMIIWKANSSVNLNNLLPFAFQPLRLRLEC